MKRLTRFFVLAVFTLLFLLTGNVSRAKAWTDLGGGDHGGADWTISSNTNIAGVHTNVGTFTINTGVTATVQAYNGTSYGTVEIEANSVSIVGTLTAYGSGYTNANNGPGAGGDPIPCASGRSGGGGGHGGMGGTGNNGAAGTTYGSLTAPITMGSGGGDGEFFGCVNGFSGGGAIKISSSSTFALSGTINANGTVATQNRGGSAGGSIYLIADSYSGSGTATANGSNGASNGGGGGGGRIAIHYASGSIPSWTVSASKGTGGTPGENGTVLFIDDTNNDYTIPTTQTWDANPSLQPTINVRNLTFQNSSTLYTRGYYADNNGGSGVVINATNITIPSGSSINGDALGYASASGPSAGTSTCTSGSGGSGGGHGGKGGDGSTSGTGPMPSDSLTAPTYLGSGGGGGEYFGCQTGGKGGGAVKLNVSNSLSLSGTISMNGGGASGSTNGGGGAGGSVYIIADSISGSGTVTANGGNANGTGGGGAGGRIAIHYSSGSTPTLTTTATAGTGRSPENGTIIIQDDTNNDIILPTTQAWYANTSLEGSSHTYRDVTIANGATLYTHGYYTNNTDGVGIIFNTRNFSLGTGSSINGNGYGYGSASGTGAGTSATPCSSGNAGGGGGYGGAGSSSTTGESGGSTYGSANLPVDLGSGGGQGEYLGCQAGYSGGGAIKINATGTLTLNGDITMNGVTASSSTHSGGGSGGSILLIADILSGTGNLTANGGNGADSVGGGGGGGRIAVYHSTSSTWSGSGTVTKGTSGSGGADGTFVNGGYPQAPTSLTQYGSDGSTSVSTGGTVTDTTVILKVTMAAGAASTLTPEFEIRDNSTSFSDTATDTGSGVLYTGSPVTGVATITGLTDGEAYHWQARVCDSDNKCTGWITHGGSPDFSVNVYTAPPTGPSGMELSDPGNNAYINNTRHSFKWRASQVDPSTLNRYKLSIDNPSGGSGLASGDFTLDNLSVSGTTDVETSKYKLHFQGFDDSDHTNNYLTLTTKSSSDWGDSELDGNLREGKATWTVTVYANDGGSSSSTHTLFVDTHAPTLDINTLGGSTLGSSVVTGDTLPKLLGKLVDETAGGDPSVTQGEAGPKVASGPREITIKFDKYKGKKIDTSVSYSQSFDKMYFACDDSEITDNTVQTCNKYSNVDLTPTDPLAYGTYTVTITGKDKAGNETSSAFELEISRNAFKAGGKITTPSPGPVPSPAPTTTSTPSAAAESTPAAETSSSGIVAFLSTNEVVAQIVEAAEEIGTYTKDVVTYAIRNVVSFFTGEDIEPPPVPKSLEKPGELASVVTDAAVTTSAVVATGSVASATITSAVVATNALAPLYASTARSVALLPLDVIKGLILGTVQYISNLSGLLFGITLRKKKAKSTVVFDGLTHKPVSGAFVVMFSKSGNLSSDFTDAKGRYSLKPRPDSYTIKVHKASYAYPSKLVTVPSSSSFTHIYLPGEEIEVKEPNTIIKDIAVPVDPKENLGPLRVRLTKLKNNTAHLMIKHHKSIFNTLLITTGLSLLTNPNIYYLASFCVTGIVYVVNRKKLKVARAA